jgi:hypothetical protein
LKTLAEMQSAYVSILSSYPTVALLYQAKDPTILARLDSIANMLSIASVENDVAAAEPFTKSRDVTVLADAAVKGVLPFGTPTIVSLTVTNATATAWPVLTGRTLTDTQGRAYMVTVGATIPASGSATVTAVQQENTSYSSTVTTSQAFYQIQVNQPATGSVVSVGMADVNGNPYSYIPDFVNVGLGELMFHLQTDENQVLYIQFGATGFGGYQPAAGEVFTVTVVSTEGAITLASGSAFTFDYTASIYEAGCTIVLAEVLQAGADPLDIATIREICSYPSLYDSNAVYNNNFDFLIRRSPSVAPLTFLSVWNEQTEESVRGANLNNMNTIFVAALKDGTDQTTLQTAISTIVSDADDSMKISYVTVVEIQIPVAITLQIASVYDPASVKSTASEIILAQYGRDTAWATRGQVNIKQKTITALLVAGITALQDENSDILISVTEPTTPTLPEQFRYVSSISLAIDVQAVTS